jgi:hypothetical protein
MDALDEDPGFQAAFLPMDRLADCDAQSPTTEGQSRRSVLIDK